MIGYMLRSDTLQITPEILSLIARIDGFKGAWRALGTLASDRLSALWRVATIESIGSSTRIEGSKLSDHSPDLPLITFLSLSPLVDKRRNMTGDYSPATALSYIRQMTN
jgi:hypothetical protein